MARPSLLLTGASGFIGQRLQALLTEDGWRIDAVVRPDSPNTGRLAPATTIIKSSLSDIGRLAPACARAQAVIYCAGAVRGRDPADFEPANVEGVASLAEAMNRSGSQAPFLLISSLAASRPGLSDYAASKHLGEEALRSGATFPWTILRPPAVYGPGDREMLPILRMAHRGLVIRPGPAGQRLSLIHVDDLARAVLAWLEAWQSCAGMTLTLDDGRPGGYDWPAIAGAARRGRTFSLGIPRPVLAAAAVVNRGLAGLFGYSPMLTPGKVRELTQEDWLCDNSAITRATGWKPAIDLERGIHQLMESA